MSMKDKLKTYALGAVIAISSLMPKNAAAQEHKSDADDLNMPKTETITNVTRNSMAQDFEQFRDHAQSNINKTREDMLKDFEAFRNSTKDNKSKIDAVRNKINNKGNPLSGEWIEVEAQQAITPTNNAGENMKTAPVYQGDEIEASQVHTITHSTGGNMKTPPVYQGEGR